MVAIRPGVVPLLGRLWLVAVLIGALIYASASSVGSLVLVFALGLGSSYVLWLQHALHPGHLTHRQDQRHRHRQRPDNYQPGAEPDQGTHYSHRRTPFNIDATWKLTRHRPTITVVLLTQILKTNILSHVMTCSIVSKRNEPLFLTQSKSNTWSNIYD